MFGGKVVCYKLLFKKGKERRLQTPFQDLPVESPILVSDRKDFGYPTNRISLEERERGIVDLGIHLFCRLQRAREAVEMNRPRRGHLYRVLVDPRKVLAWSCDPFLVGKEVVVHEARLDLDNEVLAHHSW